MTPVELTETLDCITDYRGSLCVVQKNKLRKPFDIKRVFWIYNVPQDAIRGEHANRNCTELLVAVNGSVKVSLTDGHSQCEVVLDRPDKGLYIPPMVWCRLMDFTPGTVCVCMTDQEYDVNFYINNYGDFLKETQNADTAL